MYKRKCLNCGNIVLSKISGRKLYCNELCGYNYRRRTGSRKITKGRPKLIKNMCSICNIVFYTIPSESNKFCSRKCHSISKRGISVCEKKVRKLYICKECKKEFFDCEKRKRVYCSIKC